MMNPIKLENGVPMSLTLNRPGRFEIQIKGGTTIQGIITPNNPLEITSMGDVENFTLLFDQDSLRPLGLVPDS